MAEVRDVLQTLGKGKACADDGLLTEMLAACDDNFLKPVAEIFTSIMEGSLPVPRSWLLGKIILLYKKGDATLPQNYRPITILPVLYKVFPKMLFRRIRILLESQLPPEQAVFRTGHFCADTVHSLCMIVEKADEWGLEVWVASLDAEEAFEQIHHQLVD